MVANYVTPAHQLAADAPWIEVAPPALGFLSGYDQGKRIARQDADLADFCDGIDAGLRLGREEAVLRRARWEEMIDGDLNEAQRLLREGKVREAHRLISGVRRSLDAPHAERLARTGAR